jgi:hypothetical protein
MPIAFPISPTVGQTYTYNGREWIWNGDGWAYNINAGQVQTGWRELSVAVVTVSEFATDLDKNTWLHKVYV